MERNIMNIRRHILRWYTKNRRDLPWRKTRNPYRILISEVMLQQTQVSRVLPKYREFLKIFPTIKALARASTGDVIRAWAGLGYNRRALYLQKTAQTIIQEHRGIFPRTLDALRRLPGIGEYTARAIFSFAFDIPIALSDTNHRRVVHRIFFGQPKRTHDHGSRGGKQLEEKTMKMIEYILPKKRSYDWNQALMDFGATVCTSTNPRCGVCPVRIYCKAYPQFRNGLVQKRNVVGSRQAMFQGSGRFYRGRIIDTLQVVSPRPIYISDVLHQFAKEKTEKEVEAIIAALAYDGLVVIEGSFIRLPS